MQATATRTPTRTAAAHPAIDPRGLLLCLVSAAGFGLMAVFVKTAYADGANAMSLLAVRFVLAAAVFWALLAHRRSPLLGARIARPGAQRMSAGMVATCLGFGVLYALEALVYFIALDHIDAALASLLLYLYPGIVAVAAATLGMEALTPRRLAALGLTSAGALLVLAGAGTGSLDPVGVALAIAAALLYSTYILTSAKAVGGQDAVEVSTLTATSAAVVFVVAGLVTGQLDLGAMGLAAWASAAGLALFCTVMAITAFLVGVKRVGPGTAAIVSTVELVVTVALAVALLGESLGPVQLAGGALVLAGVVLLQLRARTRGKLMKAPRFDRLPRLQPLRLHDDGPAALRPAAPAARPAPQGAPC